MIRKSGPTLAAAILLTLTLLWRMLGAPVNLGDIRALETPLWQARVLLPSRASRVLSLWPLTANPPEPYEALPEPSGASPVSSDVRAVSVYDARSGKLLSMPLEQYVLGVVAAEMPASYHIEALKAQAVASRTRAVSGGCSQCEGADVCTDSAHCQGFAFEKDCRDRWGDSCEEYLSRIDRAVKSTEGVIITYEDEPITVLYHAMSGGHTEDAREVFSQSLPYLTGVVSKGEEQSQGFTHDSSFSFSEAARLLGESFPHIGITEDMLREDFIIGSHTKTGRVDAVLIGGHEVSARDVRAALGLRSTWFTLSIGDGGMTFSQQGYGHGVGMSQAGANYMASQGDGFDDIIKHYYQGVELSRLE